MSDHDEYEKDERFDGWLRESARDYNRPPANVPRDEMWEAIQAGRATHASPIVATPRTSARRWQMAAAAVLLLGTGVVIGRGMGGGEREEGARVVATADAPLGDSTTTTARDGGANVRAGSEAMAPRTAGTSGDSYAVATVNHLARAEALLTSFKGGADTAADASLDRWARDLLADTRLLLDSPAASDPRRRHLLEDLELALAQIVQLGAESGADRNTVRRSIERGEVLTRIRSTIPAGSASGV